MKETTGYFEREDRKVCYYTFIPDGNPIALLQIVQDVGEDLSFYRGLAERLVASGVIVFGCDDPGHGGNTQWDVPAHLGEGRALDLLLEDQKATYDLMRKKYRYLPHVFLGQGVGSIVVRLFMESYHLCTDGVVLASPLITRGAPLFSGILCKIAAILSGKDKPSPFLEKRLFGLAHDSLKGEGSLNLPLSPSSYGQILSAQRRVTLEEFAQGLEPGVPVSIFSGDVIEGAADSALSLHEQLSMAEFCSLSVKIYEKAGHYLHLSDQKDRYFEDLEEFIMQVAEGVRAARSATYY